MDEQPVTGNLSAAKPLLLSIIELGGYPNFAPLYAVRGLEVVVESSMRKALALLKGRQPRLIVAEFNFQSDFRDRTSSLESLLAVVQRMPNTRVIVFYESGFRNQLDKLSARFNLFRVLPYPIDKTLLGETIDQALSAG